MSHLSASDARPLETLSSGPPPAPPDQIPGLVKLVVALVLGFTLVRTALGLQLVWPFTTDDAYITLRYARHLSEGLGIVWNPGEQPPVEGYSNFLFVILGAGALELGWDPVPVLKLISSLCLLLSCGVLYRLARLWLGTLAALMPALWLTAVGGTLYWTVSGLETAVYQLEVLTAVTAFFIGLGFRPVPALGSHLSGRAASGAPGDSGQPGGADVAARLEAPLSAEPSGPWLGLAGGLTCLAGLTRPEGPMIFLVLLGALLARGLYQARQSHLNQGLEIGQKAAWVKGALSSTARAGLVFSVAFGLPYAIYFAWRLSHFGRLFPNTVYCKAFYDGSPTTLLEQFFDMAWPWLILALLQPAKARDSRLLVMAGIPLSYAAALYGADPLIGHLGRHFLAALPLVMVLAAVGLKNLLEQLVSRVENWLERRRGTEAAGTEWAGKGTGPETAARESSPPRPGTPKFMPSHRFLGRALYRLELGLLLVVLIASTLSLYGVVRPLQRRAIGYSARMETRRQLGHWLNKHLRPEDWFVVGDAGLGPYLSHARVLDALCLNCREATLPPIRKSMDHYARFLLSRQPQAIVVSSRRWDRFKPQPRSKVFVNILNDPMFAQHYRLAGRLGGPGAKVNYLLYLRNEGTLKTPAPLPASVLEEIQDVSPQGTPSPTPEE